MKNKEFFKNIKVFGFDFDNTIVDEKYSIRKQWQNVLREYSFLSPFLEQTFFRVYKEQGPEYKFHINDTLAELKIDKKNVKEIMSKFLAERSDEKLLEGSLEFIKLLKRKNMAVGIITDGKKSYQEARIKRAGIYGFMDFIYYGDKQKKPNKEAIEECFRMFSLKSPEQFVYMGDDFISDVQGMSSTGVKVCWVTKENFMPKISKVIKVKSLKDLLKYF